MATQNNSGDAQAPGNQVMPVVPGADLDSILDYFLECPLLPDVEPSAQAYENRKIVKQRLEALIRAARVEEVEAYADYLVDLDNEAAFEMGWGEYAYKRIRAIDAGKEGIDD